jgi:small basic protein
MPIVLVLIATMVVAGGDPRPVSVGLYLAGVFLFGYVYVYLIVVWRRRAMSRKNSRACD